MCVCVGGWAVHVCVSMCLTNDNVDKWDRVIMDLLSFHHQCVWVCVWVCVCVCVVFSALSSACVCVVFCVWWWDCSCVLQSVCVCVCVCVGVGRRRVGRERLHLVMNDVVKEKTMNTALKYVVILIRPQAF